MFVYGCINTVELGEIAATGAGCDQSPLHVRKKRSNSSGDATGPLLKVSSSVTQGRGVPEAREGCFKEGVLKKKSVVSKVSCY